VELTEIKFVQQKDFLLIRELGEGATGKTVLLRDELLDEFFVCKKFSPIDGLDKSQLFLNFKREIKLLLRLNHINVVRIHNYFLYPANEMGYIIMEFIDGKPINEFIRENPHKIDEVFRQVIAGFSHMEYKSILHRDLRMSNILVNNDGIVKIIDLGFGKQINIPNDNNKSISLAWWCQQPSEFAQGEYSFRTEVYFVGMVFLEILKECEIIDFKYNDILENMCEWAYELRTQSFHDIHPLVYSDNTSSQVKLSDKEKQIYRNFADIITNHITKLESGCKYNYDYEKVISALDDAYRDVMLEEYTPDPSTIIRCFLNGSYYHKRERLPVEPIESFLELLKNATPNLLNVVFSNLYTRFDALTRYTKEMPDDDIPF